MSKHVLSLTIESDESIDVVRNGLIALARGRFGEAVEAPDDERVPASMVRLERKKRNEAAMTIHRLRSLLRRVVQHADIGHVWNMHDHCNAKYEHGPCTCELAGLEIEIDKELSNQG